MCALTFVGEFFWMVCWVCNVDYKAAGHGHPLWWVFLVLLWTWFNSGLIEPAPSSDEVSRDDVAATPLEDSAFAALYVHPWTPCLFRTLIFML